MRELHVLLQSLVKAEVVLTSASGKKPVFKGDRLVCSSGGPRILKSMRLAWGKKEEAPTPTYEVWPFSVFVAQQISPKQNPARSSGCSPGADITSETAQLRAFGHRSWWAPVGLARCGLARRRGARQRGGSPLKAAPAKHPLVSVL